VSDSAYALSRTTRVSTNIEARPSPSFQLPTSSVAPGKPLVRLRMKPIRVSPASVPAAIHAIGRPVWSRANATISEPIIKPMHMTPRYGVSLSFPITPSKWMSATASKPTKPTPRRFAWRMVWSIASAGTRGPLRAVAPSGLAVASWPTDLRWPLPVR
jgi:hypothetical protein